ncbi:MAG: SIS domain-containing protein [Chloroflexota bacterium]
MSLHSEILEQPACLERLLSSQRKNVEGIAAAIRAREVQLAFLAARGTSDNAGRYANYLWGALNGLPMALATPSLFTYYQQPPKLKNALVVCVSQSGQSPDIISVIQEGKRQGNLTLAITNAPGSPLAQSADFVLDIQAGPELSVAATKTYTNELMAIAMLSVALAGDAARWDELAQVAGWVGEALQQDDPIGRLAQRYRYMQQCVVLGRGYNYATAFEWALKLKELTYVEAEPYSSADFQHGPVAMVARGFPVMAVAATGKVLDSVMDSLAHLKKDLLAELVVISNSAEALSLAESPIPIPAGVPEWLSPLVSIVPAQLFACHLTRTKGYDENQPRTITKVTETR